MCAGLVSACFLSLVAPIAAFGSESVDSGGDVSCTGCRCGATSFPSNMRNPLIIFCRTAARLFASGRKGVTQGSR